MSPTPPIDLDAAFRDSGWLRSLAGVLVVDAHEAEDLVQEGWATAASTPPRESRAFRSWMSTVVRNAAHLGRRQKARRRRRELRAARPELSAADDALEQWEAQKLVVDAVAELTPSYRQVVLLRYYSDLTPPAIAKELALPLATVHTRLRRAHERLRDRLAEWLGPEPDLRGALLPLIGFGTNLGHGGAPVLSSGALTSTLTSTVIGVAVAKKITVALVLVLLAWGAWSLSTQPNETALTRNDVPDNNVNATDDGGGESVVVSDDSSPAGKADRSSVGVDEPATDSSQSPKPDSPPAAPPEGMPLELEIVAYAADGRLVAVGEVVVATDARGSGRDNRIRSEYRADGPRVTVRVLPGSNLVFETITVDDWPALPRERRIQLPPNPESPLVIEVDLVRRVEFVVRDAETREELQHVWVASVAFPQPPDEVRGDRVVIADQPSPIEVITRHRSVRVWAPGYAWTAPPLGWDRSETNEILLERACQLTVRVAPTSPEKQRYVVACRVVNGEVVDRTNSFVEFRARPERTIDHLPPGEYDVMLQSELPSLSHDASVRVTLRPGESAIVELAPESTISEVTGVIRVRGEDRELAASLQLVPAVATAGLDDYHSLQLNRITAKTDSDGSLVIPWSFSARPGDYVLQLDPVQLRQQITLPIESSITVDLASRELAEVRIELTGVPPGVDLPERLTFTRLEPSGLAIYHGSGSIEPGESGDYLLRTLPGQGNLSVSGKQWTGHTSVDLIDGQQVVRLPVERTCGVVFRYVCQGRPVDIGRTVPQLANTTGPITPTSSGTGRESDGGRSHLVGVPAAGRYNVDFSALQLDGYQPIAAREIEIAPQQWLEVSVELEKTPPD